MTVFITGATGHLGANLVRAVLAQGREVRALVEAGDPAPALAGLNLEIVRGDLRDPLILREALKGVESVYHCAAFVSLRNRDRQEISSINIDATEQLMELCLEAGVSRVVHTSSFGAVGQEKGRPSTEKDLLSPFEPVMDYERSKAAAEVPVFQAAARGLNVTIVNPSAMVGPLDYGPTNVGRTIVDYAHGRMRAYVPGAFDWVPIADVVAGHLLAHDKGKRGERYLLTGQVHSIDEILGWLEELTGVRRPSLRLSPRWMRRIALIKDWIEERFFPKKMPRFNQHSIRILNSGKSGDHSKAVLELGWQPSAVRPAFEQAVRWFAQEGLIPPLPLHIQAPQEPRALKVGVDVVNPITQNNRRDNL
ncbi:MAG: SDR family oxidoreductase [Polyangiaceae bacterium]|nr:SDR family oxidoreductase [Polyangiaceae bacterium]